MKYFITLLLFITTSADISSQSPLNLDKIKEAVSDTNSDFSYSSLIKKFNIDPGALNIAQGTVIYYGKLFTEGYKPYKINFDEIEFTKLIAKKKYKRAIPKGEEIIKSDPVNLETLSKLFICYRKVGLIDSANSIKSRVDLIIAIILTYGSGESRENTLKVISVGDEYAVMRMLGITGIFRKSLTAEASILDTWKADKDGKRVDFFVEVLNNLQALPSDK